jgi:hypothetical protein
MRLFLASTLAQGRKVFRDTFNRADVSGDIGRASDGSAWQNIRGTWKILNNKVEATTSDYPMISQSMNTTNNQVELYGTSTGSAAALWVTDSGNWWAVGLVQEPTDCNCTYYYNTYYYYTQSNCPAYSPGTWNVSSCISYTVITSCNSGYILTCSGSWNNSTCNNYAYNTTNKTTRCSGSWNVSNCNQFSNYCPVYSQSTNCAANSPSTQNSATLYYYTCNIQEVGYSGPYASCQTCYPQYVRVLQSAANTVSTITQWSISSLASALKVKTSGSQLTISAYSDPSMISQIGSDLVYTPTGVTITPTFGITIIPSSYNQGYTVDEIQIKRG